jgi:hypothetical protein
MAKKIIHKPLQDADLRPAPFFIPGMSNNFPSALFSAHVRPYCVRLIFTRSEITGSTKEMN